MSIGPISGPANNYVQSVFSTALQRLGLNTGQTGSATPAAAAAQLQDNGQISPFASLLNTLQQLQQTAPAKYQQVTQQIATNLQNAAQTAQSQGDTAAAGQLNQLSNDFTNASKSGQLPNVQDLARAAGGHHHHHHHHFQSSPSSTSSNSEQPSDALNPLSIITSTLSNTTP